MDAYWFAKLMDTKEKILGLEAKYPGCPQVARLHRRARALVHNFKEPLDLTDEQLQQLDAPQGGGTDKDAVDVDD